ncbi:MAG: GDSL-type esterase/lipase family protein [Ruminococcus sp.]|nr:GDSL-type esterase/lipase family protein [Ruminococcus sp.]
MKKILSAACALAVALSCTAFSVSADDELTAYEATSENVKLLGRTYYDGESLWLAHSATGFEFTFTGSTVTVDLSGDNGARMAIYADGERVLDFMTKSLPSSTTVELEEGEHTVSVLKLSESMQQTVLVDQISTDGAISPTESNAHTIEFIGDSITCGYGIDAASASEGFTTETEDGARTYAYKTAQLFDADYSMVCVSGSGIVSGYTMGDNANTQNLMPDFYENLGHGWSYFDSKCVDDIEWDFSSYTPELIVINLGTNDYSYTGTDETKIAEFADGYVAFLKQVRANNPDSEILCTLGIMGNELYSAIESAVSTYTTETGDTKVNTLMFDAIDSSTEGYGADYHPTEYTHVKAANTLADAIVSLYGWTIDTTVDISVDGDDNNSQTDDSSSDSSDDSSSETSSEDSSSDETSEAESEADSDSESEAESDSDSDSESDTDSDTDTESEDTSSVADTSSAASSSSASTTATTDSNPTTGGVVGGAAAVVVIGLGTFAAVKKRKK